MSDVKEWRNRIIQLRDGQLFESVCSIKDEFSDGRMRYAISNRIIPDGCLNIAAFYSGADKVFNTLYIYEPAFVCCFTKWRKFGFDLQLGYNEWIELFIHKEFIVWQTFAPQYTNGLWQAEIVAIAVDNNIKIRLEFESYISNLNTKGVLKRIKLYSPQFENYALVEKIAEINGAGVHPVLLSKP